MCRMMRYCCRYCFLNVLLDHSIHFLDRSDHKDMLEEAGDGQQSGYNQCTVCCALPRGTLSRGLACLGQEAGDGEDRTSGCPWGAHRSWLCKAVALRVDAVPTGHRTAGPQPLLHRGLRMASPHQLTGFLTEKPGFFCFEAPPEAS